jgi:fucose 4-O-acetylase-like acetyltransferase
MNVTLLKALVLSVPAILLFAHSLVLFQRRTLWSAIQLLGSASLVIVVLTHICEAVRLLPWMHWGAERSAGHYLDLSSAILGVTLFPAAYLIRVFTKRSI